MQYASIQLRSVRNFLQPFTSLDANTPKARVGQNRKEKIKDTNVNGCHKHNRAHHVQFQDVFRVWSSKKNKMVRDITTHTLLFLKKRN